MKVYLISLKEDKQRRYEMRKRFGDYFDNFEIIEGVKLNDNNLYKYFDNKEKIDKKLTVSELGCALSHTMALEKFLSTDENYALILEDDVIGNSIDIADIFNIIKKLPYDAFLLCGGQEGLRGESYNYGERTLVQGVFRVPELSKKFYTRACCYCVTKKSAENIVKKQRIKMSFSDNWGSYFRGWNNFFFCKKISHPIDLANSHIEKERKSKNSNSLLKRIGHDGWVLFFKRNASKILICFFYRFFGYIKIK